MLIADPLEEGRATTYSSIHAWRTLLDTEPGVATVHWPPIHDTITEALSTYSHIYIMYILFALQCY